MHIPESMLQGSICPVTTVASGIVIAASAYCGVKGEKPSASRFAAITALVFAGQMMNFPIMHGTSGHLLGGVLAASVLGIPFAILSVAMVVIIQSLFFSDGGITVLGANLFNMAIIGAGLGGFLRAALAAKWQSPGGRIIATAIASWASIVLASLAVSVQLAIDGQVDFFGVVAAMVGIHAIIGIGEAFITVGACELIPSPCVAESPRGYVAVPLSAAMIIALALSPFASGFPDGLEWVAEKYKFLHELNPPFVAPFSDYSINFISNEMLSTGLSGLIGVIVCFAAGWVLYRFMSLIIGRKEFA